MDISENTGMDLSGNVTDVSGIEIPAPPVIRLSDIVTEQVTIAQQEETDRQKVTILVNPSLADIRASLIAWATRKFQLPCDLYVLELTPPSACSDGVSRNVFDYIQFLSGKTLQEHMDNLQSILPDLYVTYLQEGNTIKVGVVQR
jgi:hypothetical protein